MWDSARVRSSHFVIAGSRIARRSRDSLTHQKNSAVLHQTWASTSAPEVCHTSVSFQKTYGLETDQGADRSQDEHRSSTETERRTHSDVARSSIMTGPCPQDALARTASSFAHEGHVPLKVGGLSGTSLSLSPPSHFLPGLVLPSPCTTYGPVVYFRCLVRSGVLRTLEVRRLFSFLLWCSATGWYSPGYGAVKFIHTGFRTFESAPGDFVAEGRWRDAWLWWLRWTKRGNS